MEENQKAGNHALHLNNREELCMTGILDVKSFDEEEVKLQTVKGALVIKGKKLSVKSLSLEKGLMDIQGLVISLSYTDAHSQNGKKDSSLLGRLFG